MKTPLRIAYVDHVAEIGGAERLLLHLIKQLPRSSIIPVLFCGKGGFFESEARSLGIRVEIVNSPKFYSTSWVIGRRKILNPFAFIWNSFSILVASWKLRQTITHFNVDIIQTNTLFSHIYGGIAARTLGIPCVWYFHDLVESGRLSGLFAIIWRVLTGILSPQIVAVSSAVLHSLPMNALGRVIYAGALEPGQEGLTTKISLHKRLNLDADAILVGFLGRIAYVKGLDILIHSAQIAVRENRHIHFIIFGGALFGEEKYKTRLEQNVETLGLMKNWHWMGYDEHAREYLNEFDFIVLPSRREAYPLTLVESGLCGKAAIASSIGGVPEIIVDGETGILVPPEDSMSLAKAIVELANSPQRALELGKNAKIRARKLFDNAHYVREFVDFYKIVC